MDKSILQTLQTLMQKQRGVDAPTLGLVAAPQAPALPPPESAPSVSHSQQAQGIPGLGFLGGLGDTTDAVTGVIDPSIMTKLNQYMMNAQAGQAPLPWQTTPAQSAGQSASVGIGSFLKLLGL